MEEPGVFLSLRNLVTLYGLLKPMEERLNAQERSVLGVMEKELYRHISIEEASRLVKGRPGNQRLGSP